MNRLAIKPTTVITTKSSFSYVFVSLAAGFAMWIMAGLYHNLLLPSINPKIDAHHEGIFLMLIAYVVLGLLMHSIYLKLKRSKFWLQQGLIFGATIGVLWTFPHGLAMAGIHNTSIVYEFTNSLWHTLEQSIGGLLICVLVNAKTATR